MSVGQWLAARDKPSRLHLGSAAGQRVDTHECAHCALGVVLQIAHLSFVARAQMGCWSGLTNYTVGTEPFCTEFAAPRLYCKLLIALYPQSSAIFAQRVT